MCGGKGEGGGGECVKGREGGMSMMGEHSPAVDSYL